MPRLSLRDRDRVLGQLEACRHADAVAADFGCHVSTIYRLLERHRGTGDVSDRRRSGRPRVTSRSIHPSDASAKQISVGSWYLKTNKRSQQPRDKR